MAAAEINFRPQQSFQHTMREIAVNREDPCEVVRELISNASDANATDIRVMPYIERKGLVFFDNGVGLSQAEKDMKNGVVPYVAFFSIGKTTKVRGQGIGYKCQGSKLCFASARVTVITRCDGEQTWRWLRVEDPTTNLHEAYDITPKTHNEPWAFLEYKHTFTPDVEFNHPFSITKVIICWDFSEAPVGTTLSDSYDYVGSIKSHIQHNKKRIGFQIGDIRLKSGLHATGNEITVLSLRKLLVNTFKIQERKPAKPKPKSK
jgi:hypothetical protein